MKLSKQTKRDIIFLLGGMILAYILVSVF